MPTKPLPSRPDLGQLRRQARELLLAQRVGTLDAAQRIREFHPRFRDAGDDTIAAEPLKLSDGLLTMLPSSGVAGKTARRPIAETLDD